MRVGQFITRYPYPGQFDGGDPAYRCGGAERVAARLAASLADAGHDVHAFASGVRGGATGQSGVTVHRYRRLGSLNTTDVAPGLLVGPTGTDLDVVHAHNSTPPGVLAGALYARLRDVPLVVTHHGGEGDEGDGDLLRRLGRRAYRDGALGRLLNAADAVVLPSGRYRRRSSVLGGVRTAVREIPNGAPPPDTRPVAAVRDELGVDRSRFVVAFVGVHAPRKGVDVLLDAFADLADGPGRPLLVVMGRGSETARLERRARRHGLTERVRFPGYVPESVKRSYLRAADVFSLPTRTAGAEMSPLVLGEAAAAGTAIVASDFPAVRGVLEDWNCAAFVSPGDPDDLAATLRALRSDASRRRRLAANGRDYAAAVPWDATAAAYRSLYRDVVDR